MKDDCIKRIIRRAAMRGSSVVMAVAVMLLAGGCGKTDETGRNEGVMEVAVTLAPLAYFAEEIGGDSVKVDVLLPAGSDPETFEPGVAAMRGLNRAGLLLGTGLMPFERGIAEKAKANNAGLRVVDLADGIELIRGTHAHEHAAGEADPHVWSSVVNARVIAANTLKAMSGADSRKAPYFKANFDRLMARMDSLDGEWRRKLEPVRGRTFAIWHPSLSYFARDYGVRQMAVSAEHKDGSAKGRAEAMAVVRGGNPVVVFVGKGGDAKRNAMFGDAVGAPVVEINPMGRQWEDEMARVVDALAAGK